jgi:hypothetical protein
VKKTDLHLIVGVYCFSVQKVLLLTFQSTLRDAILIIFGCLEPIENACGVLPTFVGVMTSNNRRIEIIFVDLELTSTVSEDLLEFVRLVRPRVILVSGAFEFVFVLGSRFQCTFDWGVTHALWKSFSLAETKFSCAVQPSHSLAKWEIVRDVSTTTKISSFQLTLALKKEISACYCRSSVVVGRGAVLVCYGGLLLYCNQCGRWYGVIVVALLC